VPMPMILLIENKYSSDKLEDLQNCPFRKS